MFKVLLSGVLFLTLTACSITYEEAEKSYSNGRIADAKEAWIDLANKGDARAMYRLFQLSKNPTPEEFNWLRSAANAGIPGAQYDYGMRLIGLEKYKEANEYLQNAAGGGYEKATVFLQKNKKLIPMWLKAETGESAAIKELADYYWQEKEYKDALKWYERCVDTNIYCTFYLGLAYDEGYGVTQDYKEAAKWYNKSVDAGNLYSARNLAWLFEEGKGVDKDNIKAFSLMRLAASKGYPTTNIALGRYYLYGIGTEKNVSKAYELFMQHQSELFAKYWIALMYMNGWHVKKDYELSYKWFQLASKQNHAASMYFIAKHYYYGYGRDVNLFEALSWYKKSADLGDVDAQYQLGFMFLNGKGTSVDYERALHWYNKAAEQGHAGAHNDLGHMYANGKGVTSDDHRAFRMFRKAADLGSAIAQSNLGSYFYNGVATRVNYDQAAYWYAMSIANGNNDALDSLNNMLHRLKNRRINTVEGYVYSSASSDSSKVKLLKKGEKVFLIPTPSLDDGWQQVYSFDYKVVGYIQAKYLL